MNREALKVSGDAERKELINEFDDISRKARMTADEMANEVLAHHTDLASSTFLGVIERAFEETFPEDLYFSFYERYITTENPRYVRNVILKIKEKLMEKIK